MAQLKLYIACSLDGQIARKDGRIDWLPDPTAEDYGYEEFLSGIGSIVMGYKTYEVCLAFGEWHYKKQHSYVFSRRPDRTLIPEASPVNEDPAAFVQKLKQEQDKDIWLLGGGEIVSLLHDADLIDEYIIAIIPVILGEGLPLFPSINRQVNLKLTKQQTFGNGLLLCYYSRA